MLRTCFLFLLSVLCASRTKAQAPPSNEEFLNQVFVQLPDSAVGAYYLVAGSDTCLFEKFDYDEWVKYYLKETVPLTTLNELAYKIHITKEPYYWQQNKLKNAVCITAKTADSLLALPRGSRVYSISQPYFTDDGQYAVMDVNVLYRPVAGYGFTLLYRRTAKGWRTIGVQENRGPVDL